MFFCRTAALLSALIACFSVTQGALEYIDCTSGSYRARVIRDTTAETVQIELTGAGGWMGVGFGGTAMSGTYAIVALNDGSNFGLQAHTLGFHTSGSSLATTDLTLVSQSTSTNKVVITRPYVATGYTFTATSTLNIICAYLDSGTTFNTHTNRASLSAQTWQTYTTTTTGTPTTAQPTSPTVPTTLSPTIAGCSQDYGTSTTVGGIGVTFDVLCSSQTLQLTLVCPVNKYCGIVFNTIMQGNAIVYYDNGNGTPLLYDVDLVRLSPPTPHTNHWTTQSAMTVGSSTTIVATRPWIVSGDSNWGSPPEEITFNWALGSSITMAQHASQGSGGTTLNLITGAVSTSDAANLMYTHGVFMSLAWAIVAPFGIFASRQRSFPPFNRTQPKAFWFLVHRISMGTVLLFVLIAFALIIAYVNDTGLTHFDSFHQNMGLAIVIFAFLQPINALIRPHPPNEGEPKETKRLIWEIVHKTSGYLICWLPAQVLIYGKLKDLKPALAYLHLIVLILTILTYAALEVVKYRRNQNKTTA